MTNPRERTKALAGVIGPALRERAIKVTPEQWDEMERQHGERDYGHSNAGQYVKWDPSERSGHTPKPRLLKPDLDTLHPTWDDYLTEENLDQDFIILGAGAGALGHAKELDGKIVYGINWTTRWFAPTFMQCMDTAVWKEEICKPNVRHSKETQIVASTWILSQHVAHVEDWKEYLPFDIIHPSLKSNFDMRVFAEKPEDTMPWAPNSLFCALNVAHWFRPRRIVLVGFDFGGSHFFGDGRQVGARGDYGFKSAAKNDLHDRLRWMKGELEARGNVIRHVGPTRLDVFKTVDTISEAIA